MISKDSWISNAWIDDPLWTDEVTRMSKLLRDAIDRQIVDNFMLNYTIPTPIELLEAEAKGVNIQTWRITVQIRNEMCYYIAIEDPFGRGAAFVENVLLKLFPNAIAINNWLSPKYTQEIFEAIQKQAEVTNADFIRGYYCVYRKRLTRI